MSEDKIKRSKQQQQNDRKHFKSFSSNTPTDYIVYADESGDVTCGDDEPGCDNGSSDCCGGGCD